MKEATIEKPSPLQKKIIKAVQSGTDLLIKAASEDEPETGFLAPVLNSIAKQDKRQGTKAIILSSHAARVVELNNWILKVGAFAEIGSISVTEHSDPEQVKNDLYKGPSVIVATPKVFAELIEEHRMIFREVGCLILDSVDDIDSHESMLVIMKRIIGKCQRIAVTSGSQHADDEGIKKLLDSAEEIGFEDVKNQETPENGQEEPAITADLTQYYINVPPRSKISTLMSHLEETPTDHVVIFTASKRTADRLYRILRKSGKTAASLHSRMEEPLLKERFERFTSGSADHLIVGELSARDLDLNHVTQVINYDVPEVIEEYKYRAELVGKGKATRIVSLVSRQDQSDIHEIIEKLGYAPEEIPLPKSVSKQKESRKSSGNGREEERQPASKQKGRGKPKPQSKRKKRPGSDHHIETDNPPMGLPRPSYDKLSGGRSGKKEKKTGGLAGFFKKLFS
ncbi:MAG: DEAD/DEAH box helicase [Balneolaceae bacterium]